mmetsp:Transcript_24848/g.70987  ORF Transcript_24848/g.70987 Transcript_24848/m.70987 type:complete len:298 (+) Transcript_24848:1221-2114(+)
MLDWCANMRADGWRKAPQWPAPLHADRPVIAVAARRPMWLHRCGEILLRPTSCGVWDGHDTGRRIHSTCQAPGVALQRRLPADPIASPCGRGRGGSTSKGRRCGRMRANGIHSAGCYRPCALPSVSGRFLCGDRLRSFSVSCDTPLGRSSGGPLAPMAPAASGAADTCTATTAGDFATGARSPGGGDSHGRSSAWHTACCAEGLLRGRGASLRRNAQHGCHAPKVRLRDTAMHPCRALTERESGERLGRRVGRGGAMSQGKAGESLGLKSWDSASDAGAHRRRSSCCPSLAHVALGT